MTLTPSTSAGPAPTENNLPRLLAPAFLFQLLFPRHLTGTFLVSKIVMLTNIFSGKQHTRTQSVLWSMSVVLVLQALPGELTAQTERAPVRDSKRLIAKRVESWTERKEKNVVMQKKDFSCGAAVLATMIKYYWGGHTSEEVLIKELDEMLTAEELKDRIENGLTMTDLRKLAVRQGYQATIGRLSFKKLTESKIPLIVGVITEDYDHFVLFRGYDGRWVYLADPSRGNIRVPAQKFVDDWQQNMALVVAKKNSKPRPTSPLHVRYDEIQTGRTNYQVLRTIPTNITSKRPSSIP